MSRSVFHGSCSRRQQKGVGLIEVMVAVLVVSIGFLGVAALQVYALSTNNGAMTRSMATVASYSILDAMRTDRSNAATAYNTTVDTNACPTTDSTLAEHQLKNWCGELAQSMGGSTKGQVSCAKRVVSTRSQLLCTVTITFDDSHGTTAGNTAQTLVTTAVL